ncbi:hypothetical protein D3C73_1160830 [compost metagenome]
MAQRAAHVQQGARGIQVDAHAQIEIRLGLTADDGGQVKDDAGIGVDGCAQHGGVGDVAHPRMHALVGEGVRLHDVQQVDARDGLRAACVQRQRALLKQLSSQPLAQKSGAAGDQDFHGGVLASC